jgi:hypothetical protein
MTPLSRALSGLPRGLAGALMVLIYAVCLILLVLTLGYEHAEPIPYLDAG